MLPAITRQGEVKKSSSLVILVPNYRPENVTAVSTNGTTLSISWMPIFPEYDNGVFQGYKILYKTTEGSSYTEYMSTIKYGNYTEDLITDLEPVTNYTLRVLAFTLSGDGLISDPVTVLTIDGEGMYLFDIL